MELFSYSYKNTLYIIQQPRKNVNRNRKTFDTGLPSTKKAARRLLLKIIYAHQTPKVFLLLFHLFHKYVGRFHIHLHKCNTYH